MSTEYEPIYIFEYIQENLVNGELPRDFRLPFEVTKKNLPYADGAKDGIEFYHTYPSQIAEESLPFLDEMLHAASREDYDSGVDNLIRFAEKNSAIAVVEDFQKYIAKQDWLEPEKLFDFALLCLINYDINVVKYGLVMTALFSNPFDEVKDIICTLGLCNEFTIFAIFNILYWPHSNDIIFELAKRVYGWGRIHAVNFLKPEDDEIRKWLMEEGVNNDVLPAYSALEVYQKAEIQTLLDSKLTDEELNSIAVIILALFDEGPLPGISAISDAEHLLTNFINQSRCHSLSPNIARVVYKIVAANDVFFDEAFPAAKDILYSEEMKNSVMNWIKHNEAIEVAEYLGISNE